MNCQSPEYPTEYYKLWWEYLKRSEDYKNFCLWQRGRRENPELQIPEKVDVNRWKKLLITFAFNNDVHFYSFDEWMEYKKRSFFLSKNESEKKVINEYNDFVKNDIKSAINFLKNILERDPTLDELQGYYDNNPYGDGYFVVHTMGLESKVVIKLVQERIKTHASRKTIIRYDEIERYLKVYDLRQEGKKTKDIVEIMALDYAGDDFNCLRYFQRDFTKAKTIIRNVEQNIFPGKY